VSAAWCPARVARVDRETAGSAVMDAATSCNAATKEHRLATLTEKENKNAFGGANILSIPLRWDKK